MPLVPSGRRSSLPALPANLNGQLRRIGNDASRGEPSACAHLSLAALLREIAHTLPVALASRTAMYADSGAIRASGADHVHHLVQLLLSDRVRGWRGSGWASTGPQRGFLRNNGRIR